MNPDRGEQAGHKEVAASLEAAARRLAKLEALAVTADPRLRKALAAVSDSFRAARAATDALARDVGEERRLLEAGLRQAQRLETIGRLVGGIAHDLNNVLGPILGYAELALQQVAQEDPLHADLREIQKLAERARNLGRHLLALGRRRPRAPKVFSLNALLAEVETILRRTIREDIKIELDLAPDLGSVRADPAQIEQVVFNLAANAQDAMPDGGTLRICTQKAAVHPAMPAHPDLRVGAYVVLSIADTGCGMDEEVQSHLFEPFFTTKHGEGTGLGLASVLATVKEHDGHIGAESRPGSGTIFRIYLPQVEEAPESLAPAAPPHESRGTETVLVTEDEEGLRNLVSQVLVRQGYEVLTARNGDEALWLAGQHQGPIHLLLTDVIMPGMNGTELYSRLRGGRPEVKVVYMSGYSDGVVAGLGIDGGQLLQKPFSLTGLTEKIRQTLGGPAPPA